MLNISNSAIWFGIDINADYASVTEQSGIIAGDGGYNVTVKEHTDLTGGIITSTQAAEDNHLNSFTSGTLSSSDIANKAEYDGDSIGVGVVASYSFSDPKTATDNTGNSTNTPAAGQQDGQFGLSKTIGYGKEADSQTAVTRSGINTQNISINDETAQASSGTSAEQIKAQVATTTTTETLATDSGVLANNFDADEVQNELDVQTRVTQRFDQTRQEVKSYINVKYDKALARKEAAEAILALDPDNAIARQTLAEGAQDIAQIQQIGVLIDSVSGALYSPNDGPVGVVANTLAPEIVYEVGQYFKGQGVVGSAEHLLAQALVAGAVAGVAGNSPASSGLSAGLAEGLAPVLGQMLYGESSPDKLSAEEKSTVANILSLALAGVGSVTGGETDIVASSVSGALAVEDNAEIGYRRLDGLNFKLGTRSSPLEWLNLIVGHEHIFFDDDGTNVGFGKEGGMFMEDRSKYVEMKYYDDSILHQAVDNIGTWSSKNYNVFLNNCQDYVDTVVSEYYRLGGK